MRGWFGSAAGFEIAFDVFPQDIAFEIYGVADFFVADVSVFVGEGNYGDFGEAGVPASDGQADAVDGDGALRDDVAGELFGDFDAVPPIIAFGCEARYAADGVHVAEYE